MMMMQEIPWLPWPAFALLVCAVGALVGVFFSQAFSLAFADRFMRWTPRRLAVSWTIWMVGLSAQVAAGYFGQDLLAGMPEGRIVALTLGLYVLVMVVDAVLLKGLFGQHRPIADKQSSVNSAG